MFDGVKSCQVSKYLAGRRLTDYLVGGAEKYDREK